MPIQESCYTGAAFVVSIEKTIIWRAQLTVFTIRYYSTEAGTTLNRKYPDNPDGNHSTSRFSGKAVEDHGKHIIIASEPSTYKEDDWHLIPRNSLVTASEEHGVQVKLIAYNPEWNAEDPTVAQS
jgi:predicted glutamine amidotransferase